MLRESNVNASSSSSGAAGLQSLNTLRLPILLGTLVTDRLDNTHSIKHSYECLVSPISFLQHLDQLPYIRFGDEGGREAHDGPLLPQMQRQLYYYWLDY